ncbi:MAG: 30S ribosomal protein THX [Cyclobacteriaceae bacterium]
MGKGDKKTKKGKIIAGSYGNSRKREDNKKKSDKKTLKEEGK